MLDIICVNWRNYAGRGVEYTNILFDMVRRNLMEGFPGRFVVYTDDVLQEYAKGIEVRALPEGMEGWWNKLYVFTKHTQFKTLFLDLDTVIVGGLDDIVAFDGSFGILRDFYRPNGLQSSVMLWQGDYSYLYDDWVADGKRMPPGGDQAWIETRLKDYYILQDWFPGDFVSYKANSCAEGFPKGSKVVVFHGEPRPHQAKGWVQKVWKVGGGTAAELLVMGNVDTARLLANREVNSRKHLQELRKVDPHNRIAVICAGGPSLNQDLAEIRELAESADVFAMNGTLQHLMNHSVKVRYQTILDARPENIRFLNGANVEYLISSQVDPSLLHALCFKEVRLWHTAIAGAKPMPMQLGGCTSVGMFSCLLAYVMGYRTLHLYGFDSSYDETHHAYPQDLNDGERTIQVECGDETFTCAPWMAQQAREFAEVIPELVRMGCEVHVHGYGLIPSLAQRMFTPRIAADERAESILARLEGKEGPLVGVEVGVFAGDLSRRLLQDPRIVLYMVDAWQGDGASYDGDSGDFHATLSQAQQDQCMELARSVTAFAGARGQIIKALSTNATELFDDSELDFVFIDADHGYEGCKRDLYAWWPKVKSGGLFSGHDYENTDYPKFGVKRAVDEFCASHGVTMDLGENFTWFVIKP